MSKISTKMNKQREIDRVLADITAALVGQFKMDTLLDQVVATSMSTLNAEVCSIFLEDKETNPGYVTMMAGSGFAKKLVREAKYKIGEGFTGTIAKHGRSYNIKSKKELETLKVEGERVWKGKFDQTQWPSGQSQFRNCIALPLIIKEQILGVIKVENKYVDYGDHFTEEEEQYFKTIANVVALAIENARLHQQIETQLKTIAAKAAHRINNQVANYDGIELALSEQVQQIVIDKQKLKEILERTSSTTTILKKMVGEFRSYGKPLVIDKKLQDLNKIIANEVWHAKPGKETEVKQELDDSLPLVDLDSGKFAEAIKELLKNSIKAVAQVASYSTKGRITIQTKTQDEHHGEIGTDGSIKLVFIEIFDNGPGFPENFPIFEPFQSTDPQSTGLGLATVKELIEAHGGTVEALQREEDGAHIKIKMPVKL